MIDKRAPFFKGLPLWLVVLASLPLSGTLHYCAPWKTNLAVAQSPGMDAEIRCIVGGVEVVIPAPSLSDGLDASGQAEVLHSVAGKYPVDRFTKSSIVAPFTLQRESIKNSIGERVGHRVDLWFVAHGLLESIGDENLFLNMVDSDASDQAGEGQRVSSARLAKRGIVRDDKATKTDTVIDYYRFSASLLDRVIIEGVVKTRTVDGKESRIACIALEEAFLDDADDPNQWRHSRDTGTEPTNYQGCAGYAKATKLIGYSGALLVECHAVFHEPPEWFSGTNFLSSKLPIAIQNKVRNFRRSIAKTDANVSGRNDQ